MKSLIKISRRYIFSAGWIALTVIFVNLAVFGGVSLFFQMTGKRLVETRGLGMVPQISGHLSRNGQAEAGMDDEGYGLLRESGAAFAFLLDEEGYVIWSWQAPSELPARFTAGEVASFTRWYWMDYPVRVWNCDSGLFVLAKQKGSVGKYSFEVSVESMRNVPGMLLALVLANLILTLGLAMLSGYRLYAALRPIAYGIDAIGSGRQVRVPERGLTGELGKKLNQASLLLETQRRNLDARDTARTEWISGVSHDIRTPLSMIMGYADQMENDGELSEQSRREASIIKEQSLKIKTLIEDLNLTSKLEYHMQPLRGQIFSPAALIRSVAVSVLNGGLPDGYGLEAEIGESLEGVTLFGDTGLLSRALSNLIGNSIRHNESCQILIGGEVTEECGVPVCCIRVRDDGKGIPEQIINALMGGSRAETGPDAPHIMGLRIVKQIVEAHGGELRFSGDGRQVSILLPFNGDGKGNRRKEKTKWWEVLWYGEGR